MARTSSSGFPARFSSENTEHPIKFDLQLHMQYLGRTYNKKTKKPLHVYLRNLTARPVFYLTTLWLISLCLAFLKVQNMPKTGWAFGATDRRQGERSHSGTDRKTTFNISSSYHSGRHPGLVTKPNFSLSSSCSGGNRDDRSRPCRSVCQLRRASVHILHSLAFPPQSPTAAPFFWSSPLPHPSRALHRSLDHTSHLWLGSGSYTFPDAFLISTWQNPTYLFSQLQEHLTLHSPPYPSLALFSSHHCHYLTWQAGFFISLFVAGPPHTPPQPLKMEAP